jgi:ABC-type sugar transport system ATPase subunit
MPQKSYKEKAKKAHDAKKAVEDLATKTPRTLNSAQRQRLIEALAIIAGLIQPDE